MQADPGVIATPIYAAQADPEYIMEQGWEQYQRDTSPSYENFRRGYEPLETYPAKWHNTVLQQVTTALHQLQPAVKAVYDELVTLINDSGQTPSQMQSDQVLRAVKKVTELQKATDSTLGGIMTASETGWGVKVDVDGKASVKTVDGTTSEKGIVQLQDSLDTSTTKALTPRAAKAGIDSAQSTLQTNIDAKISKTQLTMTLSGSDLYITKGY